MVVRLTCLFFGILLMALSGKIAPALDSIIGNLFPASEREHYITEEDDILDNKTKWRMILIGYIVFGVVAVFSLISVFTLNNKINTLYNSIQTMEEKLNSMEQP